MPRNDYIYRQHIGERRFQNRFATSQEMKATLYHVDLTGESIPHNHGGVPFISDTKEAYVDDCDYHTLILGSTGSMKTRVLVLPTVFTLGLAGENMVIADPKGEIYDKSSGYLKEKGYKIHVINLRDMTHSDSWNPLLEAYRIYRTGDEISSIRMVQEFTNSLAAKIQNEKDAIWGMLANQFITGSILMLFRSAKNEGEVNIKNLLPIMYAAQSSENGLTPLGDLIAALDPASPIRQMMDATQITAATTRAGVFATVSAIYHVFSANPALQKLSAKSTFDLHEMAKSDEKHATFIIVPDETTVFHFFCATFIKQLYGTLIAEASKLPGQTLPRRVNFILDEFANIPQITDMPTMITAARSRNIRFFLVVQSNNQLKTMYGDNAETIKTNCLNWVYLNSKEDALINQVQTLIGTKKKNGVDTYLMDFAELTTLKKVVDREKGGAQAVVLLSRSRPFMAFLPDLSRYKQFIGKPAVPLPTTETNNKAFNVKKRILILCGNGPEINRIFGAVSPFTAPAEENVEEKENPQEPITEEKTAEGADDILFGSDPEFSGDGMDSETYKEFLKILKKRK